jgi:phosphate transport system protein
LRVRLQKDIDKLTERVVSLGALVEERFRAAVKSVECQNVSLADKVVEGDIEIDQLEVDLEEECLKILALHQPVADHLRYIIAILKMNNDLERIGDHAVNMAKAVRSIARLNRVNMPFDYHTMAQRVQEMLEKSLDSLVTKDLNLAYQVCAQDDDVDIMKHAIQDQFAREISKSHENLDAMIELFLVSRHLERIADHATNIAEDVIYMITGTIHRHRGTENGFT